MSNERPGSSGAILALLTQHRFATCGLTLPLAVLSFSFSAMLPGHGSRLLRFRRSCNVVTPEGQSYEAESGILSGSAAVYQCAACSAGAKVGYLGATKATNTVTFSNIHVDRAGTYRMQVDYLTEGPRALVFTVNGGPSTTLNLGGGSFNLPASTTVSVVLQKGLNTITF